MMVLVMLTTVSCKDEFLEVAPTASLSSVELGSLAGLDGALIGTYSMLLGRSGRYSDLSNWFWGSVLGGDANKGTDDGDQSQLNEIMRYNAQTNNASVLEKYRAAWEGVARANSTLRLLQTPAETVSQADIDRITGEAKFLRGVYYFELKKVFNDVPYVDENWDEITPVDNSADIWPMIEQDFSDAASLLPGTASAPGRANSFAARAFLGKAHLFQGDHAAALTEFNAVMGGTTASGVAYALVPNYQDLFRSTTETNSETVFATQAAVNTGTVQNANPSMELNFPHGSNGPARPGGCCGFFQPSFDLANSFRTVGGLPVANYNDTPIADDMGLQSADAFTAETGTLDPRIDHSLGRREIPYLDWGAHPGFDWIRSQPYGGPYSPKKYIYYNTGTENDGSSWTPGYVAVNHNLMRFADVLLMAAECEIEVGTVATGVGYINQVRARANASRLQNLAGDADAANYDVQPYGALSQDAARTAVRMERKLELSGEGHRFFDLVRWGVAAADLNAYILNERQYIPNHHAGATFTASKNEYLPIPQDEIDLQGTDVLAQNPGY